MLCMGLFLGLLGWVFFPALGWLGSFIFWISGVSFFRGRIAAFLSLLFLGGIVYTGFYVEDRAITLSWAASILFVWLLLSF